MFESIPTDLRSSGQHGDFVLLDWMRFDRDDGRLGLGLYAPGTGDTAEARFSNVIGLTLSEDVFGSGGGQITREEVETCDEDGADGGVRGWFLRSSDSPTMRHIRRTVPSPFDDSIENHNHFLMQLREHDLSFVAHRDFTINVVRNAATPLGE